MQYPRLPDGLYPFIDERLPLSELTMTEAPRKIEELLREQAAKQGIGIVRGEPVELRCHYGDIVDATFLIYWPADDTRLHMLVPRRLAARTS